MPTSTPSEPAQRPVGAPGRVRRVTIEDVAVGAGVSVATVSRALRNLPNVADSTRRRVSAVAERLDYQPDPAAARLAAGRTGTVTIVVPSLSGWYFSTVVAGAEAVCTEAGLEFQVVGIASHLERDRMLDEARRLERRTDGLLLVDVSISPEQVASLVARDVALATIGTEVDGHPSVRIDDDLVGRLAAGHLASLGHRRLGLIGGMPEDPMSFDVPRARRRGYEDGLAERGLALDPDDVANGNFGVDGGQEAMAELLDRADPPTGVFAMSDEMAFGALMAVRERGLRVGVDVSLIGVDDHEFSRVVELTTVAQPVAEHGARAARLLLAAMGLERDGGHAHRGVDPDDPVGAPGGRAHDEAARVRPAVELVVRSTTGPAPSSVT